MAGTRKPSTEGVHRMKKRSPILLSVLSLLVAVFAAQAATATTIYSDVVGTNVSFTGIQETSSFGDPEPLFDQPVGSGNQLLFYPPAFLATAAGAGGLDQTGSQLQLTISGNDPLDTITDVLIDEYGDATLLQIPGPGTAATGTFASMSGFLTVTHDINGAITPVVIGFGPNAGPGVDFLVTYSPTDTYSLPGDVGTNLWSASLAIDVASFVPNATQATLSLDNDLYAYSELGTSAKIQKKVTDGPAVEITVIPEPTTGALLGAGLLSLFLFRRSASR
jgi:hypothetical protein